MTHNDPFLTKPASGLYTISPDQPFVECLARGILNRCAAQAGGNTPAHIARHLPHWRIFLPTRRACRHLQDAFLIASNGHPLLLPRLYALGDMEEADILLSGLFPHAYDLPPALSRLERKILLARTIGSIPDYTCAPEQGLALADTLARFMDHIYTEGLDLKNLPALVPDHLAEHWKITTRFLEILVTLWPEIIEKTGKIEPALRRDLLLRGLAEQWQKDPPDFPVLAAGSTGSIPATSVFLQMITTLPKGVVILPALDQSMDEESWHVLDETHPQAMLKKLLTHLKCTRADIHPFDWHITNNEVQEKPRLRLIRETMRPAPTTPQWRILSHTPIPQEAVQGLLYQTCETPEHEALSIALLIRDTLEEKDLNDLRTRTIAIITPDRSLAQRIALHCQRWGIMVDDSAGDCLSRTRIGQIMRLCLEATQSNLAPCALLSLLRHPDVYCGLSPKA